MRYARSKREIRRCAARTNADLVVAVVAADAIRHAPLARKGSQAEAFSEVKPAFSEDEAGVWCCAARWNADLEVAVVTADAVGEQRGVGAVGERRGGRPRGQDLAVLGLRRELVRPVAAGRGDLRVSIRVRVRV